MLKFNSVSLTWRVQHEQFKLNSHTKDLAKVTNVVRVGRGFSLQWKRAVSVTIRTFRNPFRIDFLILTDSAAAPQQNR